ncbi:hypothetical protein B296_00004510 [Ensete ventricosum]|uniref:Uncharacterized protein n=1 Tax=Ensete ventricosum TaxID=4639 RepID=A0A427B7F4_ENSVE|nr:hypothetical protein B296_00004510 [Ensete ventricosum]
MIRATEELDCSSAHIRLREPDKLEDKVDNGLVVGILKRVLEEVEKVMHEFRGMLYKSMEDPELDLADVTGGDCVRARTTRGQQRRAGEDGARYSSSSPLLLLSSFPLLLLPFFSLNRPLTVDFSLNRSPTVEIDHQRPKSTVDGLFWWYRRVACGPRIGNLADRYVPPGTGGTDWYGKPSDQ